MNEVLPGLVISPDSATWIKWEGCPYVHSGEQNTISDEISLGIFSFEIEPMSQ